MLLVVAVLFIGGAVELVALIELFPAVEMKVIEAVELVAMIELFSAVEMKVVLVVDFPLLTGFTKGIFRIRGL